jgi:hypothetical protein
LEEYHRLGTGMNSFKDIKTSVRNQFGLSISNNNFEWILKRGGVDLQSEEYRQNRGKTEQSIVKSVTDYDWI